MAQTNNRIPNWCDMLELWMNAHYKDKTCVVFSNPCENIDKIMKYFTNDELGDLVNGEYAILVCETLEQAGKICNGSGVTFCQVWWQNRFVDENT